MASMLHETSEGWHVDLRGRAVLMFTIDYRVTLHLHGESDYEGSVVLEEPFEVCSSDGQASLVQPAHKADLGPVLACFEKIVDTVAVSRESGSLLLTFTDATTIAAASHEHFEAWEVNAPGVKLIAMPGGGEPAVFVQERAPVESSQPERHEVEREPSE
jgi:hypothetical protein